jgi:hypothetical protein
MMTWLTALRTYLGHDENLFVPPDPNSKRESAEALIKAQAALNTSKARQQEIRKVTSTLVDLNRSNHYGESIYLAMMPREKRS